MTDSPMGLILDIFKLLGLIAKDLRYRLNPR
jgi:hypothetical protein